MSIEVPEGQLDELIASNKSKHGKLEAWWHPEKGKVKPEILDRRRKVAICWNQLGMSVSETAKNLGFGASTIAMDRKWLLGCWQKGTQADVVEIVSRELAKLETQEAELWSAWERSKEDVVTTNTETHRNAEGAQVGGTTIRTTRVGRLPESKFMDLIIKCQERRSKLLGLDKAVTFEGASFSFAMFVEEAYESAVDQQSKRLIKDVTPPKQLPGEIEHQ